MAVSSTKYFEARRMSVRYDRVKAIADVSIGFDAGQIISLIGANGAGKSTSLRAITGLASLTEGEIWFDDQRIDKIPAAKRVAMGIAMVPEGRRVFPLMSIRDNLLMGAYTRRDNAVKRDLERILDRFPRLRERFKQQAGTLSGGEQEMLVIGRALMSKPRLLLLDEPSLGLAPLVVRDIARLILEINRDEGTTIVLVEQNSRMALRISQYAYVLENGHIGLEGASQDLLNDEKVKQLYLGG
ncbi:branched-chain amino acid transport system ATP-binding protein [Pararhizobium capsulatum DSM 1112]|uniref:Branched-chain amino acid transport system ATP-binding protein n=1 Tax=Pararhizobium capsulatum DSM 1112 TaxID=1121113 RepID=A0ABU0C2F4_9HYPH|nr:ABC transporter ATP-binding protein [Pararhizobium capsulatum]MDQ0324096.1 branched-chain amino acid transport system ATP-binding protein [Pararhizobium capsulatum DSM 1112]